MYWVWYSLFSLSWKRYFILYDEKTRFVKKKKVFYWASKSTISVEKGVFSPQIQEKGVFYRLGDKQGIRLRM